MKQSHKNSNIKIQLACIFFAFFMWVYVMSDLDPIDTRDITSVSISVSNLDELEKNNLTLSPNQELKANVQIKGRRSVIAKKVKSGIKLQAILENIQVGSNEAKIVMSGDNTDLSYTITPSNISLSIEEKQGKSEKIQIKSIGSLAENYYIDNIKLSKDNIYVSGPSSLIEKINKVEVELDLANNSKDFSKLTKVKVLDSENHEIDGLTIDDSDVIVTVTLKKEKIVPIKLNIQNDDSLNISQVSINPETIKIQGKASRIDSITQIETKKIISSELSNNSEMLVELDLPSDIYSDVKQVSLMASIENVESSKKYEFDYKKEEIQVLSNDNNYNISIPENIKLTLYSDDTDIKKEDINLYIDVATINENRVDIKYKTDKSVKSLEIVPEYIEVTAKENVETNQNQPKQ
ncbi:YbbR-like protein [Peptoanaerobacter stomatis]|uniref:YbbR-like protein n=2 Tax=Peptoanaerobacter stomatis TaxID=796937 RepID=J6HJT1_9FIRM|nr:YbbR-like protein [Peptoanaerobacter stomatis]